MADNLAKAQTCCSGGVPISGNVGMPASSKGSLLINAGYDFNYLSRLKNGGEIINDDSRRRSTASFLLNSSYAISKTLSLELLFTYVNQQRIVKSDYATTIDNTSGLGDAVIMLRASRENLLVDGSFLTLGMGPKAPLGRSNLTNTSGITLNSDMQPGSGSWDLITYMIFSIPLSNTSSLRSYLRMGYSLKGTNINYLGTQSYSSGDEINLQLGISDMVLIKNGLWNYMIGAKIRSAGQDIQEGFALPNTGGIWIYGTLSLGYNMSQKILLHITGEVPLYSRPSGTQLSTTVRLTAGLFVNLGKSYSSLIVK